MHVLLIGLSTSHILLLSVTMVLALKLQNCACSKGAAAAAASESPVPKPIIPIMHRFPLKNPPFLYTCERIVSKLVK
jgi:hypothetical protein